MHKLLHIIFIIGFLSIWPDLDHRINFNDHLISVVNLSYVVALHLKAHLLIDWWIPRDVQKPSDSPCPWFYTY